MAAEYFVLFTLKWDVFNVIYKFFIMVSFRDFLVNIWLICPHTWVNCLYNCLVARKAKFKLTHLNIDRVLRNYNSETKNWGEFTVFTSVSFLKNYYAHKNADTSKTIINSVTVSIRECPKLYEYSLHEFLRNNFLWVKWDK